MFRRVLTMNVVRRVRATEEPELLRITAAQFSAMVEAGAFTGDLGAELRGGCFIG